MMRVKIFEDDNRQRLVDKINKWLEDHAYLSNIEISYSKDASSYSVFLFYQCEIL